MLNKDCKVKTNKPNENIDKATSLSRQKTSTSKKPAGKKSGGSKKSNKFFYIMVAVWLIPVFVSVYLLYLQYKQYSRQAETREQHVQGRNRTSPISREQLRRMRETFQSRQEDGSAAIDANKKASIYLVKVNRTVNRVYIKPLKVDLQLNRERAGDAIKKLIEFQLSAALKRNDYYSCIPGRTKLLSVNSNEDTLVLNFNNRFMDGLNGTQQIKLKAAQIVYTATQFPGINKVKFVVNNQALRDWGGEGVFPGAVLSRSDVPRIMALN